MSEEHTSIDQETERARDRSEGGVEQTAEMESDLSSDSNLSGTSEGGTSEDRRSERVEPMRRTRERARRLLASPVGPLILGIALVAGGAAAIAARNARARPGLRSLLLRSRAAVAHVSCASARLGDAAHHRPRGAHGGRARGGGAAAL